MTRWRLTSIVLFLVALPSGAEPESQKTPPPAQAEIQRILILLGRGDYQSAEAAYRGLADQLDHQDPFAEKARVYQAECLRLQKKYPLAARIYLQALEDFPEGQLRDNVLAQLSTIANYWLQDTWKEWQLTRQWGWSPPLSALGGLNFTKPFLFQEEEAMHLLEVIQRNDPNGPQADQILMQMGHVHCLRHNYDKAESCYLRIVTEYPDRPLARGARLWAVAALRMSLKGISRSWDGLARLAWLCLEGLANDTGNKKDQEQLLGELQWARSDLKWRCRSLARTPSVKAILPMLAELSGPSTMMIGLGGIVWSENWTVQLNQILILATGQFSHYPLSLTVSVDGETHKWPVPDLHTVLFLCGMFVP